LLSCAYMIQAMPRIVAACPEALLEQTTVTLRAIITETAPVGRSRRFHVGVAGEAPSGKHVNRPQYLRNGPWCKTTARRHAKRIGDNLRIGGVMALPGRLRTDQHGDAAVLELLGQLDGFVDGGVWGRSCARSGNRAWPASAPRRKPARGRGPGPPGKAGRRPAPFPANSQ